TAGKVEKEAAISKGGHKVDKISFKAEFSTEPGVLYSYEGSRRTGFSEDE
ncbi:lipid-binding protein, partial [Flavobacterium sp. LBUM151]